MISARPPERDGRSKAKRSPNASGPAPTSGDSCTMAVAPAHRFARSPRLARPTMRSTPSGVVPGSGSEVETTATAVSPTTRATAAPIRTTFGSRSGASRPNAATPANSASRPPRVSVPSTPPDSATAATASATRCEGATT